MSPKSPTKYRIVDLIKRHGGIGSTELAEALEISRQAVAAHLRELLDAGRISKSGSTRNALYHPAGTTAPEQTFGGDFRLAGLDEYAIYQRMGLSLNLPTQLKADVEHIAAYTFTELLNNAIDHSDSEKAHIEAQLTSGALEFDIKDGGIGVFASIMDKFGLADEQEAMINLVKGKTTTSPAMHTGEGIFFTARAADRLVLRSHNTQLEWNRARDDVFVSSPRWTKGTLAHVEIRRDSRVKLEKVFSRFAPQEFDFRFSKTSVKIKLLGKTYVSRSEAKRLLVNLEKFRVIELDFEGVKSIGQGFADEVFRVFPGRHADCTVVAVKANPAIEAMIKHAIKSTS
jgi:DNA-binding transcriptional ArsR family regulator